MRSALFTLALVTAIACGGRAGMDDDETEADGGAFSGGASTGGSRSGGATHGGARSSGGRFSSGGAPNQLGGASSISGGQVNGNGGRAPSGGAPARGGSVGSGGSLVGGVGGDGGAGGEPGCFTAVQGGDNYCISVAICAAQQRETLCTYDPATATTTCTCFYNGKAGFSLTSPLPSAPNLCQLVTTFPCQL
jgi:hypothetical protein